MMASLAQFPAHPPMPAVARILARYDRPALEAFIAIAIDLADTLDGDGETEEDDPPESDGDGDDIAWPEWQMRGRHKLAGGQSEMAGVSEYTSGASEDDELAGDEFDHNGSEDDNPSIGTQVMQRFHRGEGAGCPISDAGGCQHDGREPDHDAEWLQMEDDVPMLPVVSLAHNVFTDQRVPLGISNLQSSYRSKGGEALSADSGQVHRSSYLDPRRPGNPV